MKAKIYALAGLRHRIGGLFVDREFFMRSRGEVRFVRLSARLQARAAAIIAAALLVWAGAMVLMVVGQWLASSERADLAARAEKIETAEERVAAYRQSIDSVASDLEARQDMLDRLTRGAMRDEAAAAADPTAAQAATSGSTARTISMAVPGAARLARIEERQLAHVAALTRIASARASRAEAAIRGFGLDPAVLADGAAGRGGPLVPAAEKSVRDPRFGALAVLVQRMAALEDSLAFIPNEMPAAVPMASSSYGYRSDPFTGGLAFHAGIDFPGTHGSDIFAAADGTIGFVGVKPGYGNVVEIVHGGGLMTRYAHLSRFAVKPGQKVSRGQRVALMGSTGRSTGPHLHFEVRMGDRALDPRRFLGRQTDVQ